MTTPLARSVHKLKEAISRRLPQRRDDSGLTTLEWLLIVAAVAGLAALAVVLVSNVVSETSEQIAGNSARLTAAKVAAQSVADKAKSLTAATDEDGANEAWREVKSGCERIAITYADAAETGKTLTAVWGKHDGTTFTPLAAAYTSATFATGWNIDRVTAFCEVTVS